MPQSSLASVRNRGLFSNHYLFERIGENDEWQARDEVEQAWKQAREIWARERNNVESYNEAQLEDRFIRPLLREALGHHDQVQGYAEGKQPDYGFFATIEEANNAIRFAKQEQFYEHAFALGDAKRWEMELSRAAATQIIDYLGRIRAVKWAILTNGRLWRLYSRESQRAEQHYEVDLADMLARDDKQAFRYFYFFFRRAAFVAEPAAQCFLARVMAGSTRFTEGVEKDLRNRVYEALRVLAEGFVQFSRQNGKPIAVDEVSLERLKQSLLRLLYRLLFLLYAESRGLLKADEPPYATVSLQRIRGEIGEGEIDRDKYNRYDATLWDRLKRLFGYINDGRPVLGIPPYNGGLFDPAKAPFLESHEIDDQHMAEAIQKLSQSETVGGRIDYRDLGVRQLGSIYEGILEYRLAVASESMVAVREKNREKWIREADHQPRGRQRREPPRVAAGELYLVTDRGERKATGSYYTPDYIVRYIVENTVGPLIEEKREAHAAPRPLWRELLELKVLDPAMGSGHFLVAATEFLARAVVRARTDEEGDEWAADAAQTGGEEAIVWARREVARHCIFGVDLNPMAVELAKLSLWLETISRDKPLSFLDHHLKCGNSLIGARLGELPCFPGIRGKGAAAPLDEGKDWFASKEPERFVKRLTEALEKIEGASDETLDGIKEKERLYHELEQSHRYEVLETLCNVHTAHYFGLGLLKDGSPKEQRKEYGQYTAKAFYASEREWKEFKGNDKASRHAALAGVKSFFHWELEFPEVFFEGAQQKENPGFDSVIGNPPWLGVRTGEIDPDLANWAKLHYLAAIGQYDIAAVFLELSSRLAVNHGGMGVVIPKRVATNESYAALRYFAVIERPLIAAIDLGVAFENVNNDALILISGFSAEDEITFGVREGKSDLQLWKVRRTVLDKMPFYIIPVNSRASDVIMVERVAAAPVVSLDELVSIVRGAECGMNHPSISQIKPYGDTLALVDHLDVDRFSVDYSGWRIDPAIISSTKLKAVSVYTDIPKLLVRFLSADLIVGKDTIGYASTNLVYHLHLVDETSLDIDFLLAILCSRLLRFWYRTAFQNEEVKFPHVQKSHLKRLPIRRIAFTTPAAERDRLAGEARAFYDEFCGTFNDAPPLDFVAAQLSAAPERSDVVHDLLAFLAERMMELHHEKQERLGQYRDELSGLLDEAQLAKLNRLYTPSREPQRKEDEARRRFAQRHEKWTETVTEAQRALGGLADGRLEFADVWRLNERQFGWCVRKKLRHVRGMADVLGAFRRFVADDNDGLAPLMRRIVATDALIDQIVYRLYGLTEAEIAVVEGRA